MASVALMLDRSLRGFPRTRLVVASMIALSFVPFFGADEVWARKTGPRERRFEITYDVVVDHLGKDHESIEIWMPYPEDSLFQRIEDVRVTSPWPYSVHRDPKYGNAILHFNHFHQGSDPVETGESAAEFRMVFSVVRAERLAPFRGGRKILNAAPEELDLYLRPSQKMVVTDGIRKKAARLVEGKGAVGRVRALYDYVASFMRYDKSGEGWGNGDVTFCLLEARGNCSDYHSLFGSFAISVGIPVRFSVGFPIPSEKDGAIGGYHCWAEAYVEGQGWIPVDISEGDKHSEKFDYFFGAHDENRVELSHGRDIPLVPEPQSQKTRNFLIYPYVEVDGTPHESVGSAFSFREL